MKYLIDTHVLLWSIGHTQKLSSRTRAILESSDVLISAVSWWEISIKFGLGKIELVNGAPVDLWNAAEKMDFGLLPISANEAMSFHQLERAHKDPFDRMLVWQAIKNNLPLISKDDQLNVYCKYGLQLIW
jgi:PIN domain nuclease of toxin-antitoxin system